MTRRSSWLQGMAGRPVGTGIPFLKPPHSPCREEGRDPGPCGRTCGQQPSLAIGWHCPAWGKAGHRVRDWGRIWCSPSAFSASLRSVGAPALLHLPGEKLSREDSPWHNNLSWVIAAMRCWLLVGCWVPGPLTTLLPSVGFCCASAALPVLCKTHRMWVRGEQLLASPCSPSCLSTPCSTIPCEPQTTQPHATMPCNSHWPINTWPATVH